jgi:plastocyanin
MQRGISALIACSALVLAAGCGSSSSSHGNSNPTSGASATATGGPKAITTPNYGAPAPSASVQSGTVLIAYRNISIAPDTLKVRVGSTIKWTNYDSVEHTVTSDGGPETFASKTFGEGGTFQITVTKPGVIHYLCRIHPASMNGTIEVVK